MWSAGGGAASRVAKFFYVILSNDSLTNHYYTNFALMQHHKYALADLDNMIPFEREIYLNMLLTWLEQEQERIDNRNAGVNV